MNVSPGKFTLSEAQEGGGEGLTHLGHPLATLTDLKDEIPAPDDDDLDGDLRQARNHSAAGGAHGHRTKREVMAEVLAVSKAARAQKRMQHEEDEDLRDDVDARFKGIERVSPPLHVATIS
jgi:hypothetical protein